MNLFKKIRNNPTKLVFNVFFRIPPLGRCLPDKTYLKLQYQSAFGRKLNLDAPQTFNEKLQWLKLYDRRPDYCTLVDKAAVKAYVAERIGAEYVIPTLGVWEDPEQIDFSTLPERFVLKCTHDSGGVVICADRSQFDPKAAKKRLKRSLHTNFYDMGREWPYRDVPPRILAEPYLSDHSGEDGGGLMDYKVHTFHGVPRVILTCRNRHQALQEDFFDPQWRHLEIRRPLHENSPEPIARPKNLERMLHFAALLAEDIPFARVDFYEIDGRLYFGEITLYPGSGLIAFEPETADWELGQWIELPGTGRE